MVMYVYCCKEQCTCSKYIVLVYRSLELCCVQSEHHYVTVTLQWAVGQFAAMASGRVC